MNDALLSLIDQLEQCRIVVVGDAMLDIYTIGTSTRQMPEADNAPVVLVDDSMAFFGGAANVAANIASLDGFCNFICLTGDDAARDRMLALADAYRVPRHGFITDRTRPTIAKERIIANGQYVTRIDREKTHDIDGEAKEAMIACCKEKIEGAGAVILSDYCKGTLSVSVIRAVIDVAAQKNIPVLIDSKRKDFSVFAGALLAKPNMKELCERAQPFDVNSDAQIEHAARNLMASSGIENIIASRSEKGMMLVTAQGAQNFPATARHVAEVSGAGDTVLACVALAVAAGADLETAVRLANIAAGVAVEKEKTSAITRDELREAVLRGGNERKQA